MKRILYNFRVYILGVTLLFFVLDLVFIKGTYDLLILFLMFFWILNVLNYKISFKSHFMIGIVLLAIVPFSLIFKLNMLAEKISIWSYVFFIFALTQKIFYKDTKSHNVLRRM